MGEANLPIDMNFNFRMNLGYNKNKRHILRATIRLHM